MSRKRYAIAGVSSRAVSMFMKPMLEVYRDRAEIVGMLDKDQTRMEWFNRTNGLNIPCFLPDEFEKMIRDVKPDEIIVACPDALHHQYVISALENHIDVIVEKPLTTDESKCAAIAAAASASKGKVRLTFNCRYAPEPARIRKIIAEGKIGRVVSVNMNYILGTYHGASYFQRWNRLRELSGGLTVHKSCHHFDLVRWWIDQRPVEAFACSARSFYGPNGYHNPLRKEQIGDGRTCLDCDARRKCKYYMRWYRQEFRQGTIDESIRPKLYEGYTPRQCMFDPEIDIDDTWSTMIKYDGGAFLSYTLDCSAPYEGYTLAINGTEGRIEWQTLAGSREHLPFPDPGRFPIIYLPLFGAREKIDVLHSGGGHGGGDPLLLDALFIGPDPMAEVDFSAGLEEGIEAVLTGVAVYQSSIEQKPISIARMREAVYPAT